MSIGLVANIAVMLIAFLSMLKFVNSVLGWLGGMVGLPEFSFEVSCFIKPFKRQPHKMVKHTQTIHRQIVWVYLTIFWDLRLTHFSLVSHFYTP